MTNQPSVEALTEMHRRMLLTRRIEERLGELHKAGKTRGPLHRCDGQEAIGVAATTALRIDDYVTTTHRGHHVYVGKGLSPYEIAAEILGRSTGANQGRAGHMLVGSPERGMIGGNAIVGAGIPAATGMALSIQMLGQDRVALCLFGDGAAQTGICHESMNIAALWKLPVIFLLENNKYGLTVHQNAQSSVASLYQRASAYGMPGHEVDGNDVVEVYQVVAKAMEDARAGNGPTLIEAKTYRLEGFSTSDMGGYQPVEEIEEWRRKDPILRSAEKLKPEIGDKQLREIDEAATSEVADAFERALADPFPSFVYHESSSPYLASES